MLTILRTIGASPGDYLAFSLYHRPIASPHPMGPSDTKVGLTEVAIAGRSSEDRPPRFEGGWTLCRAGYSLILLLRMAAFSFLMSSGDNRGRSILSVSLLSFPVKVNGGL